MLTASNIPVGVLKAPFIDKLSKMQTAEAPRMVWTFRYVLKHTSICTLAASKRLNVAPPLPLQPPPQPPQLLQPPQPPQNPFRCN